MENKLLSSVKAGAVGVCVFGLSQTVVAANVQISGQIDTYIESYTAGDKNTVRMSSGGGAGGSRVTFPQRNRLTVQPKRSCVWKWGC